PGRGDVQVVAEAPADEALHAEEADQWTDQARRHSRHDLLDPQHPPELPLVRVAELGVVRGRFLARLAPLDDAAQLPSQGHAEVERGADSLGGQRQAVAGRVADEEDAAPGRRAQLVGDPVALVADRVAVEVLGERLGGPAKGEAGREGAAPDPGLPTGREGPAVAGRDVAAVDPDLEVLGAAL